MKATLRAPRQFNCYTFSFVTILLLALLSLLSMRAGAHEADAQSTYAPASAASTKSSSYSKKKGDAAKATNGEALDEAMAGKTLRGTPVTPRTPECFPAEQRDVFWQMDQVATGTSGELKPLNFDADGDGKISDKERNAIRGRNTWLLWGGGNETFWGWLAEEGYGLNDLLILLDSRERGKRFQNAGVINQPGFKQNDTKRVLGLYLDEPDPAKVKLTQPPDDIDPATGKLVERVPLPGDATHKLPLFEEGKDELAQKMLKEARAWFYAADDGLDPTVYGYPSGIFGLRLMLNPDFFGNTKNAEKARNYWNRRVATPSHSNYYSDVSVHSDPQLVRPFRVTMSCGFCHVSPHPLNPPKDPENPGWENLSSIIGDQFWRPQPSFGNLLNRDNLFHHFLASQPPGTIDTSLVSTDWINNPNTINAIFDVPARLERAKNNTTEMQSAANLRLPSVEDGDASVNPRHFPRVLIDGADSVGVFGALIRVPLNIGTYFEQWRRTTNSIIGFSKRRPFSVETSQTNSVYWQTNERYRIPYEAAFFTMKNKAGQSSTAAMKLAHAPGGKQIIDKESAAAAKGRDTFLQHCAICHSSKQPKGFQLDFTRDFPGGWDKVPKPTTPAHYNLPMEFAQWDIFKKSSAYADYVDAIRALAGPASAPGTDDPFITDNFLSNEVRIPVGLVGTNPARATATNGLRGEVWDNFSSDDYKNLPAVGPLRYFDPFSGATPDSYGNNANYTPGGGGRGYYRPASLISLWATAPYLHNNALGLYNHDPSVEGRLTAYQDAIEKLLWKDKRAAHSAPGLKNPPLGSILGGDLRPFGGIAAQDTGYIYRAPLDINVFMAAPFIRPVLVSIAGGFIVALLEFWIWLLLFAVLLWLAFKGSSRHAVFLFVLLALITAALFVLTGLPSVLGWWLWLIPLLFVVIALAFLCMPITALGIYLAFIFLVTAVGAWRGLFPWTIPILWLMLSAIVVWWARKPINVARPARVIFALFAVVTLVSGVGANRFMNGKLGDLKLGPIPRGTPVNLILNMDQDGGGRLLKGLAAVLRGVIVIKKDHLTGDKAYEAFVKQAAEPMMHASKCPDFVLDRGHYFGEQLSEDEKKALIAFLKTL